MNKNLKLFFPNYFSFFFNGAIVLLLGSVLPFIIQETGISYTVAGTMLSLFALGNFSASLVNPILSKLLGRKNSILITSIFQPFALFFLTLKLPVFVFMVVFFTLGICRGCYSILNNAFINEKGDGSASALNILHMVFAIGAFISPLVLSFFVNCGLGWRYAVYFVIFGSAVSFVLLFTLDYSQTSSANADNSKTVVSENSSRQQVKFWKSAVFYVSGFLLFFYLGLENCVNGWFVSYFKDTGIMSQTFSNSLVSFTWAAVLFGRMVTAVLAKKMNPKILILTDCIATAIFFILLTVSTNLLLVTISILGLGFFFAGIYPTVVANAGKAIRGSDAGTSALLAIAALGGIITPQIVGTVADKTGLMGAISLLVINVAAMIILGIVNCFKINGNPKSH